MCEQCMAECKTIGEVFPGWTLMQATKDSPHMGAGAYGLVESNDPTFVFTDKPRPDPAYGLSDDEMDALPENEMDDGLDWTEEALGFGGTLVSADLSGLFRLFTAMTAAGYNPDEDGHPEVWLYHRLGTMLENKD